MDMILLARIEELEAEVEYWKDKTREIYIEYQNLKNKTTK